MKKRPNIKILLLLNVLALSGFMTIYGFSDAVPAKAKTDDQELERLFHDMEVIRIPGRNDPLEITLKDLYGNPISLSAFRGKIVFLNFWTTWCPTCRVEMPSMQKLHQRLKDKAFAMVAVNIQESSDQVKRFYDSFKLTFITLMDATGEVATGLGIREIPTTLILDKKGRVIGGIQGPRQWDSKKSIALFEHLIAEDTVSQGAALLQK